MRVACPHCNVAYNIDDRRVPPGGIKVRCPKCRNAFPVRPAPAIPLSHHSPEVFQGPAARCTSSAPSTRAMRSEPCTGSTYSSPERPATS